MNKIIYKVDYNIYHSHNWSYWTDEIDNFKKAKPNANKIVRIITRHNINNQVITFKNKIYYQAITPNNKIMFNDNLSGNYDI